ncbi:MAG: hypothetical protein Q8Q25_00900, partial [bacterium]|nr:hypothetical protein [bacterium]
MFKIIKKPIALLTILFSFQGFAADILQGDQELANASFSFPIKTHTSSLFGHNVYVGAHPNQTGLGNAKTFALAAIGRGGTEFIPLTPEKVKLNGTADQSNPMFDTGIQFLSLIDQGVDASEHPVVVLQNDLSTIYLLHKFSNPEKVEIANVQSIKDANGNQTSGIVQLTASIAGYIFAAVKAQDGSDFGTGSSGIALLKFGAHKENNRLIFSQLNGLTGLESNPRAVALNKSSSQLKIGADLAQIKNNAVAMHVSPNLGLIYVGLQVTAAGGADDGARAITVGRLSNDILTFAPIAPDSAFDDTQNKIVGTEVGGADVSIHEIKSLLTSTALPYLIIRGGNGDENTTRNKIFALPLVRGNSNSALNGTIANKNADPEDIFDKIHRFSTRVIKEPATTPADMPTDTDVAVVVGGAEISVGGNVTEIFVQGDSVFAEIDGD